MTINDSTRRFIHILNKIPMFHRLSAHQSLEVLKACRPRTFNDKEILFKYGGKSSEMFVLLSGNLLLTAPDGTLLTRLSPITSVGEMGVVTGQTRTATVVADEKVSVFEISKIKFEVLIKKYPDIGFVVYRNLIETLSERLDITNQQFLTSQRELSELQPSLLAGSVEVVA